MHFNAVQYFGSWENALTNAGVKFSGIRFLNTPRKIKWSKERVLDEIMALYEKGEKLNTTSVNIMLYNYGRKYFGSWKDAIGACGMNYEELKSKYK